MEYIKISINYCLAQGGCKYERSNTSSRKSTGTRHYLVIYTVYIYSINVFGYTDYVFDALST